MRHYALLVLALSLWSSSAFAQATVYPSQLNPANTQTTATSGAVTKTYTGVGGRAWRIYELSAYCSTGTSGITIAEAGTTTWSTPAAAVTTTMQRFVFPPYTAAAGATVVVTLATCGSSNTGTLNVIADVH